MRKTGCPVRVPASPTSSPRDSYPTVPSLGSLPGREIPMSPSMSEEDVGTPNRVMTPPTTKTPTPPTTKTPLPRPFRTPRYPRPGTRRPEVPLTLHGAPSPWTDPRLHSPRRREPGVGGHSPSARVPGFAGGAPRVGARPGGPKENTSRQPSLGVSVGERNSRRSLRR